MTIVAPGIAARHVEPPTSTTRQYIRYLFYKARPSWRLAAGAARRTRRRSSGAARRAGAFAERLPVLRAYSTLGTRGDVDFLLWMVSERLEDFQELQAAVLRSPMGAHGLLTMPEVLADQLASVLRARRADVTPGVLEVAV